MEVEILRIEDIELPKRPAKVSSFESYHQCINSWKDYFSKKDSFPRCEICGRWLKYLSGIRIESVHFDHKKVNVVIKGKPYQWLRRRKATSKNIAIWESCNFGVLCNRCNFLLPTKNRRSWLEKVIRYVNKS